MWPPPYLKPPVERCDACGVSFYLWPERYRVRLLVRGGPFDRLVFKKLHLCPNCLAELRRDKWIHRHFRVRYRKMRPLHAARLRQEP